MLAIVGIIIGNKIEVKARYVPLIRFSKEKKIFLKIKHRHTFKVIKDRYEYIRTARAGASVELLCLLLEVSRSRYYEWLHRKSSAHEQQD